MMAIRRGLLAVLVAGAPMLQAQDPVLLTGSLSLKGGRPEAARVGSIVARLPEVAQVTGGEAVLVLEDGTEVRLPCGFEWLEGTGPLQEAIWRLSVPDLPASRRLTLFHGGREVGRLVQEGRPRKPEFTFVVSWTAEHLSVAYALRHPLQAGASSLWVRGSTDGGRTWDPKGHLLSADEGAGEVELDALAKVPEGQLVLEWWVLQGLTLERIRQVVKRQD